LLGLIVSAGGCQSNPFSSKPSATAADIAKYGPTSAEKIKRLQEQAEQSKGSDALAQQQNTQELARQIQTERDPLVRAQILRTLALYPTPLADAVLHAATNDPEEMVRLTACELWGQRPGEQAVKNLKDRLNNDESLDVRLAAARALGKTGQKNAVDALAVALEDPNPAMQFRAVESLKNLSGVDLGDDVQKWREYVQTPVERRPQPTIADRLGVKRLF
jgi:HEAT repeat protein